METLDPLQHFDTPDGLAWANAIDAQDTGRLRQLAGRSDPNQVSGNGMTPLQWAMRSGRKTAFAELLQLGAKPRPETAEEAFLDPSPVFASMILDSGFDVSGKGPAGDPWIFTPLLAGNRTVLRMLVERGAPVSTPRADGTTPLIALAGLGEYEDAFWLLERGADPAARPATGITLAGRARQVPPARPSEQIWHRRLEDTLRFRGFEG